MGNRATSARLTVVYSSSASSKRYPDEGTVSTGLMEGQQVTIKFQSGQPVSDDTTFAADDVASVAASGAAKKMYKVKRMDTGEMYALKTPGRREDVLDHVIAAQHAKDFGPGIRFVVPILARVEVALDGDGDRVEGWENMEVLLEPLLEGVYEKFVCRRHKYGSGTFIYHPIPQAFFHFTYESSGRTSVIWDLQGIKEENGDYLMTDPYIVHDQHTIWRYGSQHKTFQILHTECNDRCPRQHVEQSSSHLLASKLLEWHPSTLQHVGALPVSFLHHHTGAQLVSDNESCCRCLAVPVFAQ